MKKIYFKIQTVRPKHLIGYIDPSRKRCKVNDGDKADSNKPFNSKAMRVLEQLLAQPLDRAKLVDVGVGNYDASWFKVLKTP